MTEHAGGRRRSAAGLLVAGTVLATGCATPHLDTLPGLARPVASASDGVRLDEGDQAYSYRNIHLVLPKGWSARFSDDCLTPPDAESGRAYVCPPTALRITARAAKYGQIDPKGEDLSSRDGWKRPWSVCPDAATTGGTAPQGEPETVAELGRRSFTAVSGERVESAAWILRCDGVRFDSRVWYVPEVDVELSVAAITDMEHSDGYDAIARSLDFSRYQK
ncbi:hypothetical protein [Nocardiopsis rhodophaea]|uniref:hypothetical protein n=1 Tax=Nocardiopsis rhodophaea TaxID=280238 RepID=UPI0031CF63CB